MAARKAKKHRVVLEVTFNKALTLKHALLYTLTFLRQCDHDAKPLNGDDLYLDRLAVKDFGRVHAALSTVKEPTQ